MNDAIRSEWIKFRSVRANMVLIIIAIGAPIVLSVLLASLNSFDSNDPVDVFGNTVLGPCFICAFLAGVLGVLGIGQEYRHNTIRVTFAAQPRRSTVLAAKTLVYGAFGLAIGLLTPLLCWSVSGLILKGRHIPFEVTSAPIIGQTLFCGLMTLFGFGLGCVLRQPAGAIPAFLLWPLIAEGLIGAILNAIDEKLVRWLPFQAGIHMAIVRPEFESQYFGRLAAGLYFGAWTLAVVAFGWWLVERRDA